MRIVLIILSPSKVKEFFLATSPPVYFLRNLGKSRPSSCNDNLVDFQLLEQLKMAICLICDEEIPKVKRCAHGKKPTNCGGACLTAYVEEHMTTCEGKNVTGDKEKAEISQEVGTQAAKDEEDNNEDAIDLVAEGADVSAKDLWRGEGRN